jgi:hypothetical protein
VPTAVDGGGHARLSLGFVPLPGMVGYGATVPRLRGGRSDPPGAPCSVILGGWVGPPRGTLFRISGGVGPPPRAAILRGFPYSDLIPAVILLIPGIMFRNPGGWIGPPRGTMFRNSGRVGRRGIPDGGTVTYHSWQKNETLRGR